MPDFKPLPSQEELRFLFEYEEGKLIRKHKARNGHPPGPIGTLHGSGYYTARVGGVIYSLHRLIYQWHHGNVPVNRIVDHHDRNKTNNLIENLRLVPKSINNYNKDPMSNNKTGCSGVDFVKCKGLWRVRMGSKFLCYCETKDEAITARLEAEKRYGI
jgi:hypothetical protein